jgi:hypothetical protein
MTQLLTLIVMIINGAPAVGAILFLSYGVYATIRDLNKGN